MEEQEKKNTKVGCLALIIIIAAIGVLVWSCTPDADQEKDLEVTAFVIAQQFVEEQLKAPSTAKYPWGYKDYVTDLGEGRYRITAYVDSENSFGAMVRTKFTCVVKYVGEDKWICEKLNFAE